MKILYLTLKKQWFDMVKSGHKLEEYRELKDYWHRRFNKHYDAVQFTNGYSPSSPRFLIELRGIDKGVGRPEWGAPNSEVYILRLGNIITS